MEKIKVRCITNSLKLVEQGKEYDVERSTSSTYYIETSRGLIGYLKERFEVVSTKVKDHNDFKIGDIITYIPGSRNQRYAVTNENGIYKILSINGNDIHVEVLTNISDIYIGHKHLVSKQYFKYVENQVVSEDSTSGEKPVERTEKEIMDGIIYRWSNSRVYINVPNKTGNGFFSVALPGLSTSSTNISCGVYQAYNLNGLHLSQFKNIFSSITRYPQSYITQEIYEEMLKNVFKLYFENFKIGFLIMSTNLTENVQHCQLLTKILGEFDFITMSQTYNRNSNHKIRLWVCDLYKHQVTDKKK